MNKLSFYMYFSMRRYLRAYVQFPSLLQYLSPPFEDYRGFIVADNRALKGLSPRLDLVVILRSNMNKAALDNLKVVESAEHFQSLLSQDLERVSLINFWAPWAEPCKQMNQVVTELARKYPNALVLQVCIPAIVPFQNTLNCRWGDRWRRRP